MRQTQATGRKVEPPGSIADQRWHRTAARWRVITYIAAVLPLLVMVVLARVYPNLNRTEIPDWRPVFALAEESWKQGDLYQARHLYLRADRIASWRQDWDGLVAAACGIYRLDSVDGPYSKAFSILIRATMAAEVRQSRPGVATVSKAFVAIGTDKAGTAALARIQPNWPDEAADNDDGQLLEACRARAPKTRVSK